VPRLTATQQAPLGPLTGREPSLKAAINALGGDLADRADGHVLKFSLDVSDGESLYFGETRFQGFFARTDFNLDGMDEADFRGTDLRGSCLLGSSTFHTDFRGADLRSANLRDIENLAEATFDGKTLYDSNTRWPRDFKLAQHQLGQKSANTDVTATPCQE
jgi:uncharacterized protein YjbI with pentapeptide repeats